MWLEYIWDISCCVLCRVSDDAYYGSGSGNLEDFSLEVVCFLVCGLTSDSMILTRCFFKIGGWIRPDGFVRRIIILLAIRVFMLGSYSAVFLIIVTESTVMVSLRLSFTKACRYIKEMFILS